MIDGKTNFLFVIQVTTPRGDTLRVFKEYLQFKTLHDDLSKKYSTVSALYMYYLHV